MNRAQKRKLDRFCMAKDNPRNGVAALCRCARGRRFSFLFLIGGLLLLSCRPSGGQPASCTTAVNNATVLIPDTVAVEGDESPFFRPDSVAVLSPEDTCVGAARWQRAVQTTMAVAGRGPFEDGGLSEEESLRFRLYGARGKQHRDGTATFAACEQVAPGLQSLCRDDGRYQDDAIYVLRTMRLGPLSPNEAPQVQTLQLSPPAPNPVQGSVRIRFATPERQAVEVRLYDVLGRAVRTLGGGKVRGRHEIQADLSGLASGTYFVRLRADEDTKTRRITVVR